MVLKLLIGVKKSSTEPSAMRSKPNIVASEPKLDRARMCQKKTSTSQKNKKELRSTDSQKTQEPMGRPTYDGVMKRLLNGVKKFDKIAQNNQFVLQVKTALGNAKVIYILARMFLTNSHRDP